MYSFLDGFSSWFLNEIRNFRSFNWAKGYQDFIGVNYYHLEKIGLHGKQENISIIVNGDAGSYIVFSATGAFSAMVCASISASSASFSAGTAAPSRW